MEGMYHGRKERIYFYYIFIPRGVYKLFGSLRLLFCMISLTSSQPISFMSSIVLNPASVSCGGGLLYKVFVPRFGRPYNCKYEGKLTG